ncbi:hypothetical protein niasHT_021185 [Heterodera trifolii]|uniref:Uncharacterized protein n=1 Tax=Heterodera trifolii TaxID=157864 RepID=A0ABD2KRI0_9BILA
MLLLLSIFSLLLPVFLTFSPFSNAFPVLSKTTETATNYNANDPLRSLPPELDMGRVKEVVPEEAADFFDQLTGRDKQVLREVLAKADTYQSTGESVEQLRNAFGGGFSLSNLKAQAQQLVVRYRQLDASTKEELRNAFPTIAFGLDNPVVQTMAPGLFDIKTKDEGPMGERGRERNGKGERGEEGDRDNGGMTRGGGRGEGRGGEVEDEVGERAKRRNVVHRRKNRSTVSVASMAAAATSAAAVATNVAMSTMINQQRRSDLGRRDG